MLQMNIKKTNFLAGMIALSAVLIISNEALANSESYNWTGIYVGANLGSIWTESDMKANHRNFIAISSKYSHSMDSTDVNPGFQFGYLNQLKNNFVLGAEADFTYPATNSTFNIQQKSSYDKFTIQNNLQGSLRLRAGYAINRFLPFITTGVSFADMNLQYASDVTGTYTTSTSQVGWVLGAGLEYGVLENLSVRTEYLYTDYGNAMHLSIPTVSGLNDSNGSAQANMSTHVLRAAVNYRF